MPRTKGSKNRPKTTHTDYASQIAEKQESITSLTAEITSIQKAIEEQKNTLKEKKTALKKTEKEVATLEAKKAKAEKNTAGSDPMKKLDVQDQVIPDNVVLHGLKQRNGKFIVRIFGEASRGQPLGVRPHEIPIKKIKWD